MGINRKAYSSDKASNRGGNYNNNGSDYPAFNRNNNDLGNSNNNLGLRLALIFFLIIYFKEYIQ